MSLFLPIFMIILGIMLLSMGLYFFYTLLPLWYGLFGAHLGLAISQLLFGNDTWMFEGMTWILIIGFAIALASISYFFEPYRRYLLGILVGVSIGVVISASLGITGVPELLIVGVMSAVFAFLTRIMYDTVVILGSSFIGAALIIDGSYFITGWEVLNRFDHAAIATIFWVLLAILGFVMQFGSMSNQPKSNTAPIS